LAVRPIDKTIAGGIRFAGLDANLQIAVPSTSRPAVLAGEMLDWEAPTGGYLMTCCHRPCGRAGCSRHFGKPNSA
jgi:predicted flavoprotein YhiN